MADDDDEEPEEEEANQAGGEEGGDGMPPVRQRPHTTDGFEEFQKAKAKKQSEEKMLKETLDERKQLQSKVVRLRQELLRSRSTTAMHRYAMQGLKQSDAEKEKMKTRKGIDKKSEELLKNAKPASESALVKFSTNFRKQHEAKFGALEPNLRNWYGLFKKYDTNFDHCISFPELRAMVRDEIRMPEKTMPDKAIMGAFKALDDKAQGLIDAGSFGRLYRKAEATQNTKDLNAVAERFYKGAYVARPLVADTTGYAAEAKNMHYKARAKVESDALTPLEEARIEARKEVQKWTDEQKELEKELKKIAKEEKKLARTLSKRGALRTAYSGPPGSLAETRSASRSMLVDKKGGKGGDEGDEGDEGDAAEDAGEDAGDDDAGDAGEDAAGDDDDEDAGGDDDDYEEPED